MPSEQFQELRASLTALPDRSALPVEELRAQGLQKAARFPVPADVKLEPVDAGGVPGEWIAAPGAAQDTVLLWFHGGGYYRGSIATVREMVSRMSRAAGVRALAIDYRLAPEHPFPAAVEDCLAAYRWLQARGYDPARIVVGGDSAGGGLTCALLVATRDMGGALPAGGVCLSPWVDLTQSGESYTSRSDEDPSISKPYLDRFAGMYVGDADARDPLASPLFAALHGLPPLLVQVGTAEVLLDDARRLAEKARVAGVAVDYEEWPELTHVWHNNGPDLPESNEAIARIAAFIRERL